MENQTENIQPFIPGEEKKLLMDAQEVCMDFNSYTERTDALKEVIVKLFRGKLKKQKFHCLKDLNFRIHYGESVAFIGRNGAGKSTLLKIIAGTLMPSRGKIDVFGKITPLLQLGAGFDSNANGLENIYLNAAIMGYTKKETEERMEDILRFAELGDFINSPVKNYSSGMLARLGFSIAINMPSDILLVDEILGVGDAAFQKKCYARLQEKKEQGTTFIIVSHSASVVGLCERAIWLRNGRIEQDGDAKTVIANYSKCLEESAK